jgi:hypothetical protein
LPIFTNFNQFLRTTDFEKFKTKPIHRNYPSHRLEIPQIDH